MRDNKTVNTTGLPVGGRLLRRPEVEQMTCMSTSLLYREMGAGRFPKPLRIGRKMVAWRESDVLAWIDALEPAVQGEG